MFHPGGGVHFLGHDQGLGVKIKRDRCVSARGRGRGLDLALHRLQVGHGIDDRLEVVGRGAAASAHDIYAVLGNKTFVILGQLGGAEFVDGASTFVVRQAGVGQDRNELGRIDAQEAHRVVHLFRAGGAVEADHVHVKWLEGGERSADLGSEQHGAGGFERDLHGDGQTLAGLRHGIEDAHQHGFGLKQVLTGLGQKDIHTAFDQG